MVQVFSENIPMPAWQNSDMMKAIRREPTDKTPIWLMRQAGRYMSEYRAVRENISFLQLCRTPKLCAEVMQTAVEKIGVDAAIIFSDLLPILEPMNFGLEFTAGDGPIIHQPFRTKDDLKRVKELEINDLEKLSFVFETVSETRRLISEKIPVIGFSGAPFTLASYAIEGGSSRNYLQTKCLMFRQPEIWTEFLNRIARSVARYLNAQMDAGAQIVQIFDSWIGCLGTEDYRRFVLPSMKILFEMLKPGIPVIHFGTGNPELLPLQREAGGDVLGVDWRIELDAAREKIGNGIAIQGNMDPTVLLTDEKTIRQEARRILKLGCEKPGFIFNLGHGIFKETPVENVQLLVQTVHEGLS